MINKEEVVAKITVTKEAEEAVSQIVIKVNEGFEAGRVNRQDVASWIISRFIESFSDVEIQQLRSAFFNEIALLEAILKKAKQSGNIPAELKAALIGQMNMASAPSRKSKRYLTRESINDGLMKDEEAA
ncbi:hypothetical protein [Bdellovibrio sp.]|uniref:hypothetical protein n=1 Tax=Bdellovibrio sp. TaxID=28201 RepID=UPI0039E71D95